MLIGWEMFWDMDSRQIYSSLNTGKSSVRLSPATSDSCTACWQWTLSSQLLLMWSSQYSLQNLAKRNKRMENLFMLIWSERYWHVNSRHVYSSLNMGKSSPSLWPATRDSCCPCWQYTLSSQILLMRSSQESLQKFAIRYKRMEALLMLIWSEMFWVMDSRQVYSSLNTGKSSPSLWPATSDSCCACWQYTLSSQILLMWSSLESL